MNRREFLKTTGRFAALAAIAAVGGYSLLKETNGSACNLDFACAKCRKLDNCELPEAKDYKQHGQRK